MLQKTTKHFQKFVVDFVLVTSQRECAVIWEQWLKRSGRCSEMKRKCVYRMLPPIAY